MASKKKLEAAVEAAKAELTTAQNAYSGADARLRAARRALDAAELALVQSRTLSDVSLGFLAVAAMPNGYTYQGRTEFSSTIRALKRAGLVDLSRGTFDRVTVTATDAGRAKLAEMAKKGGA